MATHSGSEKESSSSEHPESTWNSWLLMLIEGLACCQLDRAQNTVSVSLTELVSIVPRNTTPFSTIVLQVGGSVIWMVFWLNVQLQLIWIIDTILWWNILLIVILRESLQEEQLVLKTRSWKLTRELLTVQEGGAVGVTMVPVSVSSKFLTTDVLREVSLSFTTHWYSPL